MEIKVTGIGKKYYKPDETIININIYKQALNYEDSLNQGVKELEKVINELVLANNFKEEELKTRNYLIQEEKKYDDATKSYITIGYSYSQDTILKFKYDKEILSNIIYSISKFNNSINCTINFSINDKQNCQNELLISAYEDAYKKALCLAKAANLELKECTQINNTEYMNNYYSETSFNKLSLKEISNSLTPTDIELSETIEAIFLAK